jgi:hypothetical protein
MARNPNRVTENQVALVVCQVAAAQQSGVATFSRLKREIPSHIRLSNADQVQSVTRPNEEMWEQQIRNIKSHWDQPGNYINDGYLEHVPRVGYRVTSAGIRRAQQGIP